MTKRLPLFATLFALVAMAVMAAPVSAGGNSSTPCALAPQPSTCTYTLNVQDATQTFPTNVPCIDPPNGPPTGILATTYNAVFHETVDQAGDGWLTTTMEGSLSFIPFDPSRPSYSGHLESWFGASINQNNAVFHETLNTTATGSDGSQLSFHLIAHMSISASGIGLAFTQGGC